MSVRLSGALALALGFALACTGGTPEAPPPPPPPEPPPPVVEAPPPVVAATGDIGVPECDAYVVKMTACLAQMDPAGKAATEVGFKQAVDAWRAAAATPEGKAGLAMGCKAALDAIPATCAPGAAAAVPAAAAAVEVKATEPVAVEADPSHTQGKAFTPRPGQGDDGDDDKKKKKKKKKKKDD